MHLRAITGQPGNGIIVCGVQFGQATVVFSVGRIRQCVTSFGSHCRIVIVETTNSQ